MSEDVKVKFGGDFSQVQKGASEAGKGAGAALGAKINEQLSSFGTSMAAKIGAMFAVDAIFETLKEGIMSAKEYFSQLNASIRTTGASGDEFQRVAGLGKSVGVSLEVIGRSMGLFSKYMGNASKDAKSHGKALRELGFSNEQITAGTITATQVLAALSKQLTETGDENIAAANATLFFGRAGRELLPIIKKGEGAITEQSATLKVYSEAELQAAEAAERAAERRTAAWKKFFRFLELGWDKYQTKVVVMETSNEVVEEMKKKGVDTTTEGGRAKLNDEVVKKLKAKGVGTEAQIAAFETIKKELENSPGFSPEKKEQLESELADLKAAVKRSESDSKKTDSAVVAASALTSSSLQAIGGGDINSVLAGTYQDTMLDAAVRTADNTQKIAEKEPTNRPTLTVTK